MFKIAAADSNRVRKNSYTPSSNTTVGTSNFLWSDFGVFTSKTDDADLKREEVANMIDTAFANCLKLKEEVRANASLLGKESAVLVSSYAYFGSAVWYTGCINVKTFSKYNVGLVWYYYNLWTFNYFIAYAGMIALVAIFGNIFFGMVVRMIKLMCLFMLYPTFVGIGPLDGNKALGSWRSEFIKNVLMGYGAIAGMNIAFILLDEFQKIYFFRSDLLNNLMSIVLMIAILAVVKDIISLISSISGGEDANSIGEKVKQDTQKTAAAGGEKAMAAANLALKIGAKFDPTLKALYLAKKKLDAKLKAKKQSKAAAEINMNFDDFAAMPKQAESQRKEADDERKDSERLEEESNKDTEAFAKLMEENKDKPDDEGIAAASSFGSATGNDDVEDDSSAENIYRRYVDQKNTAFEEIDSDTTLSDEDKETKKQKVEESLRESAVEDFQRHNIKATEANEHYHNYLDKISAANELQKKYDDAMKKANKPSAFKSMIMDLGGSTIKLVGDLTFVSAGWSKMGKTGLIDEFKTFGQAVVPYSGEGVRKSFMTKKQKDDKDKADEKAYTQALYNRDKSAKLQLDQVNDMIYHFKALLNARDERKRHITAEMSKTGWVRVDEAKTNIKNSINSDAAAIAAELRKAGRPTEAKRFENNSSAVDSEINKIKDYAVTIADEEISKGGTKEEIKQRINDRVNDHVSELISQGRHREAAIVNKNKARGLNKVR